MLDDALNRAYLRELTAYGAQVRVTVDVLEPPVIMDARVAMVPIDPADSSRQGDLIIHRPSLLAAS
ncbi:MAG TPA: hypothetical protein VLJ59_18760 [Mycobacteriales bacterium]|nr:hypothetical protein [Mycobacteriales bacterium]